MMTDRLRSARETAGLSIKQACRLLGTSAIVYHLDDFESGAATPTSDDLRALATLYGCSVAWLRGETATLSSENEALLRTCEHTGDRETLREFMQMISTRDPGDPVPPSAQRRLAQVAAKHEPAASLSAKRRHVASEARKAPTRAHHCHWTGCTKPVPPAMWGCLEHWRRLPKSLRDRIWAAYKPGQEIDLTPSETYLQVADDVHRWIAEQAMERAK